ncbi:hypothetical protein D3C76_759400 [compost metagenome]
MERIFQEHPVREQDIVVGVVLRIDLVIVLRKQVEIFVELTSEKLNRYAFAVRQQEATLLRQECDQSGLCQDADSGLVDGIHRVAVQIVVARHVEDPGAVPADLPQDTCHFDNHREGYTRRIIQVAAKHEEVGLLIGTYIPEFRHLLPHRRREIIQTGAVVAALNMMVC